MNCTAEEWRTIPGYEDYEVSSLGRVRSWKGVRNLARATKPHLLTIRLYLGRPTVGLSRLGVQHSLWVHKLVMKAFVGPRPEGLEICHNNGDPTDNRLSNLRYDTHQSNVDDRCAHGRTAHGEAHANARLTEAQVLQIRSARATGATLSEIAMRHGVGISTVSRITARKAWAHVA